MCVCVYTKYTDTRRDEGYALPEYRIKVFYQKPSKCCQQSEMGYDIVLSISLVLQRSKRSLPHASTAPRYPSMAAHPAPGQDACLSREA